MYTNGKEKLRILAKIFIQKSDIVILVYDITNKRSFEELDYWKSLCNEILINPVIGIVGNKKDLFLREEVEKEKAQKYAEENNALFKLTSAKNEPSSFIIFLEDLLMKYIKKTGKALRNDNIKKIYNKNLFFKIKQYSL